MCCSTLSVLQSRNNIHTMSKSSDQQYGPSCEVLQRLYRTVDFLFVLIFAVFANKKERPGMKHTSNQRLGMSGHLFPRITAGSLISYHIAFYVWGRKRWFYSVFFQAQPGPSRGRVYVCVRGVEWVVVVVEVGIIPEYIQTCSIDH